MRVHLFAFGKLKTPGLREAANYYQGLIGSFVPFTETELKPLSVPDKSPATRKLIQEKEAAFLTEKFSKQLSPRALIYLLDEDGKCLSTRAWAQQVRNWEAEGAPELAFCVGSSLGFSDQLRKSARGILSLGAQTLPHELARVVLCEQIYRAWSVTRNHPYHNEG